MSAIGPFARWAAHMLRGGYSPVPLRPDTGLPAVKRWNDLRLKPMDRGRIDWFARRLPDLGLAVAGGLGGLVPIDVDTEPCRPRCYRQRMQAYADKELDRQVSKLAGLTSGRHDGAYRAACAVGKFVRGGFLSVDEIERALMGACATNKLTVARGADHCRLQIANGIKKGSGDTLPVLADRPRPAMRYQQAAGV